MPDFEYLLLAGEIEGPDGAETTGLAPVDGLEAENLQEAIEEVVALLEQRLTGVQEEGVGLPFAPQINFFGTGVTAAYNEADNRYDVEVPGVETFPFMRQVTHDGVDLGVFHNINFVGQNFDVEFDAENDRYDVMFVPQEIPEIPEIPVIPDPPGPATTDDLGLVKIFSDPLDPENPVVIVDDDERLTDTRIPTDFSVTLEKAATEVVLALVCESDDRPEMPKHGQIIFETDTLSLMKQISPDPNVPEWVGAGNLADFPLAADGEEDPNKIPRANDIRLYDDRPARVGSVNIYSASADSVVMNICTSETRPVEPRTGQIIYETDSQLVMKQVGPTAEPNWLPIGTGAANITIQEEGITVATRSVVNFVGEGATVVDDPTVGAEKTVVRIPGLKVQAGGVDVSTHAILNFLGVTSVTNDPTNNRTNITLGVPPSSRMKTMLKRGI